MNERNYAHERHAMSVLEVLNSWDEPMLKSEAVLLSGLSYAYAIGLMDGLKMAGFVRYLDHDNNSIVMVELTVKGALRLIELREKYQ